MACHLALTLRSKRIVLKGQKRPFRELSSQANLWLLVMKKCLYSPGQIFIKEISEKKKKHYLEKLSYVKKQLGWVKICPFATTLNNS